MVCSDSLLSMYEKVEEIEFIRNMTPIKAEMLIDENIEKISDILNVPVTDGPIPPPLRTVRM